MLHNRRKKMVFIVMLLAVMLALFCLYVVYTNCTFRTDFYQVESQHVRSDLRIVYISDLHLKEYGERNEKLISRIELLLPDIILTGGDLVTYPIEDYDSMLGLASRLSEIAPVYGCMGNHEDELVYLRGVTDLVQNFRDSGLNLLQNEVREITIGDNTVELVSVSGGRGNFEKYGAKDLMDSIGPNDGKFRIVLAHVPVMFRDKLSVYDYDLGLAGHTHGGIVNIPGIGGLFTNEEGFFPDIYAGVYSFGDKPLIVSQGMGDSHSVPRINDPHELLVIDVKSC